MALAGEWQTDRARLLASEDLIVSARRATVSGIPGTNKKSDGEAVSNGIVDLLVGELSETGRGLHAETVLSAVGALAGFSAQMAIREFFVKLGKISEEKAFVVIKTKSGETFYFGDLVNEPLVAARPISVWGFVGGAAQHLGAKTLPDLKELFAHVAASVGHENFGVPRLPPKNMPHALPIDLLDRFWNPIRNYLAVSVDNPGSWPFSIGLAAQKAMLRAKGMIDPALAATIVMEAAVPMSKIDPARIRHASFWE